ncbi:MAG: hypothetical protein AAF434_00600 [Pseudomonadota bacterium]
MRLERMGARFQTRLSFMRSVLRRLHGENWSVEQTFNDWDENGFGTAVYRARGPQRSYSLIAFSDYLDAADRSDRVIAEKWDAAFTLFDGEPTPDDIARLRANVPNQEAGRCSSKELTLSRANKSVRLFEHVADRLSNGQQPDTKMIAEVGYLMRTTAVYGNGKFGLADRERTCSREELANPYQAELLTVYLIRCFTHDLVEHVARTRNPEKFVPLDRRVRRHLGIGNATGLGMAPFLYHHPTLLNNWISAMETALASVRSNQRAAQSEATQFNQLLVSARTLCNEWQVEDTRQMRRIERLRADLDEFQRYLEGFDFSATIAPWDTLFRWCEEHLDIEAQELVATLMIEIHPHIADPLAQKMGSTDPMQIVPAMPLSSLLELIESHYQWALELDFESAVENHFFWYASEEKLEPRVGERFNEPGSDREHLLTAARDVSRLHASIAESSPQKTVAEFLIQRPEHRHIVRRVQSLHEFPYAEIRENLLNASMLPIDMLRFKLSFFGATKFDPKSDKWTRINMYQGAPLPDELTEPDCDRWMFLPHAPTHAPAQ